MVMAKTDPVKPPKLPPRPLPQPPEHQGPDCVHPPIKPKPPSFEDKDANHDGKLNADEFNEGRGIVDKVLDPDKFDRYDADNDGYVTQKENFSGQLKDAFGDFKKSKVGLPDFKPAPKPEAPAAPAPGGPQPE